MATVFASATANRKFSSVEGAISAVASGIPVIVVDAEDRENEGDFVVAAEKMNAELAHFMMSVGRGQMCIPVSDRVARQLDLERLPVSCTEVEHGPAFAMPIDHRSCETGVSPTDRALTANQVVHSRSSSHDFIRPGHMFPLIARSGGVMERQGHTEASVDLVKLAGCKDAAVLCEVCSSDGQGMARRDELLTLGEKHGVPVLTICSLVEFQSR